MSKKIILFNGPKSCGKGIAVECILNAYSLDRMVENIPCKEKLMTLTQEFFMVSEKDYWTIYNDRTLKEEPLPQFRVTFDQDWVGLERLENILGYELCDWTPESILRRDTDIANSAFNLSIREAVIFVSEVVVKPHFGQDWFGKARANRVRTSSAAVITDDSCGFEEEIAPLLDVANKEDILLVRIFRDGYTFAGDSRDYVSGNGVGQVIDVFNNGTEEEYLNNILETVGNFIEERNINE